MIEVLDPGPLTTVQDLGRAGWAALGVPRSGAFDRPAARLANRLVGNADDAAVLEMTLGGLRLALHDAATVALTGAPCPGRLPYGQACSLPAGSVVQLGRLPAGLRSYLAVRGGLAVQPVLGSRSTDLLSGLGPAPLQAGDRLPVGRPDELRPPSAGEAAAPALTGAVIPIRFGPRDDWFTESARHVLGSASWTVRADSDRIGVRLDGPPLTRARGGEIASEPTRPGAIQVPPDGRPIVFGPDAPVTGGYPVIAVAAPAGLAVAAQLRPGDTVRFRATDVPQAAVGQR